MLDKFALFFVLACLLWLRATDSFPAEPLPVHERLDFSEMTYSPARTTFRLWAPTADAVKVNLYTDGRYGDLIQSVNLVKEGAEGWISVVDANLNGKFYTFSVQHKGDWLPESPGIMAKAVGVNGNRGAILDLKTTFPPGWESDVRPEQTNFSDVMLYELNPRDFTLGRYSGVVNKGKYLGLAEQGTTNRDSLSTGLDHLVELGVTHVLLMPTFDFKIDDEARPREALRNWNLNPVNYFVPDGLYALKPYDPVSRLLEFREMVMSLHAAGIRVVLDVAYDHSEPVEHSHFSRTAPGYFYRKYPDGKLSDASGVGNELATEKEKTRRFILQSMRYWVEQYHVDGFRFERMDMLDVETVRAIRNSLNAVDSSLLLLADYVHGGRSALSENERATRMNASRLEGVAWFNRAWRIAVNGLPDDSLSIGYLSGVTGDLTSVQQGIAGGVAHPLLSSPTGKALLSEYQVHPGETVNFWGGHQGYCLYDKLRLGSGRSMTEQELKTRVKLAYSLLLTAQGIPFLFSGDEFLRSRQGHCNTVLSPDSISRINWDAKTWHEDVSLYCQELIRLRKEHPAFRMRLASDIAKHLVFQKTDTPGTIAFMLTGHANRDAWKDILVVHNNQAAEIGMMLPEGTWHVVVKDGKAGLDSPEPCEGAVRIGPVSTMVAYR